MKDTTIAAALNKYVNAKCFPITTTLHEFDQGNYSHTKKYLMVHHLNCMRKLHKRVDEAKTNEEFDRILDLQIKHIESLAALFGGEKNAM